MKRLAMQGLTVGSVATLLAVAIISAFGITVANPAPAAADDSLDARHLVEKSKLTFDTFVASREMDAFRNLLKRARGVFIAPQVVKGAFIFGVSGGSGVLVARDSQTGQWNGPTFYTIGEASFGLQAGGQASQLVFVAMTERGVSALLSSSVKLGADIGVAVGPVGVGAKASTANLSADILSFSLSQGLYGGISIDGAVVATRGDWNSAYYKKGGVTPTDILIRKSVSNQHATGLINAVAKAARAK